MQAQGNQASHSWKRLNKAHEATLSLVCWGLRRLFSECDPGREASSQGPTQGDSHSLSPPSNKGTHPVATTSVVEKDHYFLSPDLHKLVTVTGTYKQALLQVADQSSSATAQTTRCHPDLRTAFSSHKLSLSSAFPAPTPRSVGVRASKGVTMEATVLLGHWGTGLCLKTRIDKLSTRASSSLM